MRMLKTWEVIAYALVLSLPFLPLMLYPFRAKFRFGRIVTGVLLAVMETLAVSVSFYAIAFGASSLVYNLIYGALFFFTFLLLIDAHVGKIVFVLLVAYNSESMVATIGKYIEWLAAPAYAAQYYHWSYSVFILVAEAVLIPVIFLLFRMDLQKGMDGEHSMMWGYLWFVPAIFSVILSVISSSASNVAAIERCKELPYVFSVIFVNAGMLFICHLVLQFVQEEAENAKIKLANQSLLALNMQYENLSKRVEEARCARHDLRHHFITLSSLAEKGNIEDVREYLQRYSDYASDDSTLLYCGNMTANALFVFYARAAQDSGIDYSVTAALAEQDTGITDVDLTVVLGNLLENAIEACRRQQPEEKKWITVNAYISGNAFFLAVDNSYNGQTQKDKEGRFLSTKHDGCGIGMESVKSVILKYGGEFRAMEEDNQFCVSLVMYMPDVQAPEQEANKEEVC